ncbi:MAG: hypothetical protein V1861_07025 [Candidatus Micrarchaeota archaeon]
MGAEANEKTPLELEAETQKVVSASISKIEVALSEWDSAKKKPDDLNNQVACLRRFYGLLTKWEKNSLSGSKDTASAQKRLRRFAEICTEIESSGMF